jgi:carbon-monoxide dehydrogenase medium subunit
VKPPPFRYLRPDTAEGVLDALAEYGDEAKLLAGGQSLVPLLNFRLARPSVLIDLELVDALRGTERREDSFVVGAMTRQSEAERSQDLRSRCPLVGQALALVGHLQIRNRGTVGGSVAHADPAAELPAVALALDAELVLRSSSGDRSVPAAEFFVGPFTTALRPDELLTHVRFPNTGGARTTFLELARRSGDFALAGVCAIDRGARGSADVALAGIGVGGSPVRLSTAEEAVRGRELTDEVIGEAAEAASAAVDPPSDIHADGAYRRELLGVLVRRALRAVA